MSSIRPMTIAVGGTVMSLGRIRRFHLFYSIILFLNLLHYYHYSRGPSLYFHSSQVMELFTILPLTFVGIILHGTDADECSSFQIFPGTVTTPGYPEVKDVYSCTDHLSFQTNAGIHVINIIEIKLYYEHWALYDKCTMSFQVGEYDAQCESKKECIVYYNDDSCEEIITRIYSTCKPYKTSDTQIEVTVTSNGDYAGIRKKYPKGVKMNYEYVTCPIEISTTSSSTATTALTSTPTTTIQRSTTRTTTKITATTQSTATISIPTTAERLTTSASEQKRPSTSQDFSTIQFRSNPTSPGRGSMDQYDMTVIVAVVCTVLILILILAIVAVLVLRRRKIRKAASTGENVHRNANENGTAETVYSVAYANFTNYQSNQPNQDNLYSFAAPDQSEIATYSTLDHEFGQSNRRNQDIVQSENENAYSSLIHDHRVNQSIHDLTAGPQEVEMYSTIGREPESSNTNGIPSRKVTVRYKVQPTVDEDVSTSREMVENVLYGAR